VVVGLGLCCLLCIWLGVVCRVVVVCRRVLASLLFAPGCGIVCLCYSHGRLIKVFFGLA